MAGRVDRMDAKLSSGQFRLVQNDYLRDLEDEHRKWLAPFHPQHLRNFENLLSNQYEGAMTEAATRRLLTPSCQSIEPAQDLGNNPSPDFLCSTGRGRFYVEATHISIEKAIEVTTLPHPRVNDTYSYQSLTKAIWSACKGKARQCSNLPHPALVAVGTFHELASILCITEPLINEVLTGDTKFAFATGFDNGAIDPTFRFTNFFSSAFLDSGISSEPKLLRRSVSGLLVCGFAETARPVLGLLHPDAANPFDRTLLPTIRFCEVLIDAEQQSIRTRWSTQI